MPRPEKLSSFQLAVMMYPTVLATGFLALPSITAQYAAQDLWMTGLLASVSGLLSLFAAFRLHKLYPGLIATQYAVRIAGRIPGLLIAVLFTFFFLYGTATVAREYAEFVTGNFLFKTPLLAVICSMIFLCAFAIRGGPEILARCSVIFTPLFAIPSVILLALLPSLDFGNVLPVLDRGFIPVLKGTATPMAWISELFVASYFLPSLSDPGKAQRWCFLSLGAIVLSMTFVNVLTLLLLGPDTGTKMYPILVAFRYIRIGHFIENMEAVLLAMWVFGNFVKIGVFYYASVRSLADVLSLEDYRPMVFPVGLLILLLSIWGTPTFTDVTYTLRYVGPFYFPFVMVGIPFLLLGLALLRQRSASSGGGEVP